MARNELKLAVVIGCVMLLLAGIAMLSWKPRDPLAVRVAQILQQDMMPGGGDWKAGMNKLWALGPGVIPHLAAKAGLRDSMVSRNYTALWQKLPALLKRYLPKPIDRAGQRQAAMHAIAEFGPLAVRGAAPQVIAGLGETNDQHRHYAVQCVRWLLPDSASALAGLESGLKGANPGWPVPATYFDVRDDKVWARIPGTFPLLTNFLQDAGHAYHAGIALGRIGSNAAVALPALIQTADHGVAGVFADGEAARMHLEEVDTGPRGWHMAEVRQDDKGMNHNRAMAVLALGRVGVATPKVRAALVRAWNAPSGWVRNNAAQAVILLGMSMTNDLPDLLGGLKDSDGLALRNKLRAIWKMGPVARGALETLRELTETNRLRMLVTNQEANSSTTIEDLALLAKMAIFRLDPAEGRPYLPEIVNRIGYDYDPVECLIEETPLAGDVVRATEPLLEEPGIYRQSQVAKVILRHDPGHSRALAVLRQNESAGELKGRLLAGMLLFELRQETNGLCSLIAEGFRSPDSSTGQYAANLAEEMGAAALPAMRDIKQALWHQDEFVRGRAGEVLLKLAPQELPINGAK